MDTSSVEERFVCFLETAVLFTLPRQHMQLRLQPLVTLLGVGRDAYGATQELSGSLSNERDGLILQAYRLRSKHMSVVHGLDVRVKHLGHLNMP